MGLSRIIKREDSQDKEKHTNHRWEEVDGENEYLYDTEVVISADKRCLGMRSGRSYYSGSSQCSSRAVQKTGGHLCKKCFEDFTDKVIRNKKHFIREVATTTPEEDGELLYHIWIGVEEDVLDDGHWVKNYYNYGADKDWAGKYHEWETESYLISAGELSPDEWSSAQQRGREQLVANNDRLLHIHFGYNRSNDFTSETTRLQRVRSFLVGDTTEPWDNVPTDYYIDSVKLHFDGRIEINWEEDYNPSVDDINRATEYLTSVVEDSRFKVEDIDGLVCSINEYEREYKEWMEMKALIESNIAKVFSDVCDRPFPWESKKNKVPNLLGDVDAS